MNRFLKLLTDKAMSFSRAVHSYNLQSSGWNDCAIRLRHAVANCAALPTAGAGQYATSYCKPFTFSCK